MYDFENKASNELVALARGAICELFGRGVQIKINNQAEDPSEIISAWEEKHY